MAESKTVSIWLDKPLISAIDERRPSTTSRSEWVKQAIRARLEAEQAGEWDEPNTPLPDGGTSE